VCPVPSFSAAPACVAPSPLPRFPFEVCYNYTRRRLKTMESPLLLPSRQVYASNNPYGFIHRKDAFKTLTVLEQPVLPVELNATLEPATDFRQGVEAPATQASLPERASE
jgi:hypothetical protein